MTQVTHWKSIKPPLKENPGDSLKILLRAGAGMLWPRVSPEAEGKPYVYSGIYQGHIFFITAE